MQKIQSFDGADRLRKSKKKSKKAGLFSLAFDDNLLNASEAIDDGNIKDIQITGEVFETKEGYQTALSLTQKLEQSLLGN